MSTRETPELNAGSMADIAFLLLIFFLVTTTLDSETGIFKKLPSKIDTPPITLNERNVLEIRINPNNEIQVENSQIIGLGNIKQLVMGFVDNGARTDADGNKCDWCNGKKDIESSDHPSKAVVSLQSSRKTSYGTYIGVQDEINSAYAELRNNLAQSLYGTSYTEMVNNYNKSKKNSKLKSNIEEIKEKYPQHISEKELVN